MKKYLTILILSLAALFNYGCNQSNQGQNYTVGIVSLTPKHDQIIKGFKAGMETFGYNEGENIAYIYEGPLKDKARLKPAVKTLIKSKVDLIYTATTPATKAAQAAYLENIPVVFAPVFDPVQAGIVSSLSNHGKNLTGVQVGGSTGKALEYLYAIAPNIINVLVPSDNITPSRQSLSNLRKAADKLGIKLIVAPVKSVKELQEVFAGIDSTLDAIWLLNSPFLVSNVRLYKEAAIRSNIPLASGASQHKAGVMVSYGQKHFKTGEQASRLAHKILQGMPPANLPIETCDFFLGINLQTAQAIGITVSENILKQADYIIR